MATVAQIGPRLGIAPTCAALGLPRATYYRRRRPPRAAPPRRRSPRALGERERVAVLEQLHAPRFVDLPPGAPRALCCRRSGPGADAHPGLEDQSAQTQRAPGGGAYSLNSRPDCLILVDRLRGSAPPRLLADVREDGRLHRRQRRARRRPSSLFELAVGQQAHGDDLGADRREFLSVEVEARGLPPHVRQRHRPRHRHRPGHPGPVDTASDTTFVSPVAAPVPLAALRVAGHKVAALRRLPKADHRPDQYPAISAPEGLGAGDLRGRKAVFFTLAFAIPLHLHSARAVLVFYAVASGVFQVAHCVEEAEFPLPRADSGRIEHPWAVHQAETTVDFARRSRVATWLLGGLNFRSSTTCSRRPATSTTRRSRGWWKRRVGSSGYRMRSTRRSEPVSRRTFGGCAGWGRRARADDVASHGNSVHTIRR
jgi:hypothetical protein